MMAYVRHVAVASGESAPCSAVEPLVRLAAAASDAATLTLSLQPPSDEIVALFDEANANEQFKHVCILPRHLLANVKRKKKKLKLES